MNKNQLIRLGLTLALVAVLFAGVIISHPPQTPPTGVESDGFSHIPLAASFSLRDQKGASFTEKNLLGRTSLVYFGFTFCPAVCPMELQKISMVMKKLGPDAAHVQPVFVTVDPGRDTPKIMAAYVAQFDPRLLGLTGSQEQVDSAIRAYHAYARKVKDPKMTDYTMDHSSYIYLVGADGTILRFFGPADTADQIAAATRQAIHR